MEVKASVSYIRESPRKLRLMTAGLRKLRPQFALQKLQFQPQKGREVVVKLIKQAMANATNNFKLVSDGLVIEKIEVNEGPRIKRMDKSHGARFDRGIIKKRSARILLTLTERPKEETEIINKEESAGRIRPPSPRLRRINGTKN